MPTSATTGLHWPGWPQLWLAFWLGMLQAVWFALVYGGTDWFTRQHSYRLVWHTRWDLLIPFVPAAYLAYLSLNALFWVVPFVLRTRAEIYGFVITLAAATAVAGCCFLALPLAHSHSPVETADLGNWQAIASFGKALALEYNYVPSLHVAYTAISFLAMRTYLRGWQKAVLQLWCGAIVISTLLTHQHYLIDVVTGLLLGWLSIRCCYRPWLARAARSTAQSTRPNQTADQADLV